LSSEEKLVIGWLTMDEVVPDVVPQAASGYDYLKRLLPQIERISFTDEDLAGVVLDRPNS
jgi:hypothetical protein